MLKRLFTPGRTQAFDKEIPAGSDNIWVAFEGSNYGLPMEPGTYVVTLVTDGNVQLQSILGVNLFKDNSYNWVKFTEGVAVRLRWESRGELRFRVSSEKGGYVTVLVTPVTNSLSLSLVNALTSCVRRWRHGTKENRQWPRRIHLQRHRMAGSRRNTRRVAHLVDGSHLPASRNLLGGNHRHYTGAQVKQAPS